MTQDEIIEMAKQAGIDIGIWEKLSDDDDVFGYGIDGTHENLETFAKLVAAKEREVCAKACEQEQEYWGWDKVVDAAKIIRARG
jgi:hypothetical protein